MEPNPRPDPVDDGRLPASDRREMPGTGGGPGQDGDGLGAAVGDGTDEVGGDGVGEEGVDDGEVGEGRDPLRFSNWMKRSATGAVMTGIAVGLKEALQSQKKEVPFVIESREEPDDPDKPIDLHFDPDSPEATVAIIRRPRVDAGRDAPPPPPRAERAAGGS